MTIVVAWEVHLGNRTQGVRVIAPMDASLDEVGRAGQLGMLTVDLNESVRPEHAVYDEEFWRDQAAQRPITAITRCKEVYVLHPSIQVP